MVIFFILFIQYGIFNVCQIIIILLFYCVFKISAPWTGCVAVDCSIDIKSSIFSDSSQINSRVTVVNEFGQSIFDDTVISKNKYFIIDVDDLVPDDFVISDNYPSVIEKLKEIFRGRCVIGHDLERYLGKLQVLHVASQIRNTMDFSRFQNVGFHSLSDIVENQLNIQFEDSSDTAENAKAVMKLYVKYKDEWEYEVQGNFYYIGSIFLYSLMIILPLSIIFRFSFENPVMIFIFAFILSACFTLFFKRINLII